MKCCPHCGSEFPRGYKFCIRGGSALIEIAEHGPGGTVSPGLINWLRTHKLIWISAAVFAVIAIAIIAIVVRLPVGEALRKGKEPGEEQVISKALRKGKELRGDLLWSTSIGEGLPVKSVAFSPDGRFLAVAGGSEYSEEGGAVMVISTKDGSLVKRFPIAPYESASWVAYSPDGRFLGARTSKGMRIWRVADGSLVGKGQEELLKKAEFVSFSRDGLVASVMWDPLAIGIFRVQDGKLKMQRLIRTERFLLLFSLSPDWNAIAGKMEGSIRLWRLESDRLVPKWEVPIQALQGCGNAYCLFEWEPTFSPDGGLLALPYEVPMEHGEDFVVVQLKVAMLRTEDGAIVWTSTGEFHEMSPDRPPSSPAVFSPDGSLAAMAGPDGVRIWRVTDGQLLLTLEMVDAYAIAFSPRGDRLAAGALGSGEVRLWRLKVR